MAIGGHEYQPYLLPLILYNGICGKGCGQRYQLYKGQIVSIQIVYSLFDTDSKIPLVVRAFDLQMVISFSRS
jgi:hypothetical protein